MLLALTIVGEDNAYDPLVAMLDTLTWDGIPRVGTLLNVYLGAERNAYVSEVERILSALPPLTTPSGSMLATIAFAITVRALTKSWGAPPQSLRIASSRWRMLLGLLIGLPPP